MPRFQLEIGVFLTCCALFSSILVHRDARPDISEGNVALPIHNGSLDDNQEEQEVDDPFNVTKPEDMVDGYPIHEEEFWKKMHVRKLVLATMFTLLVIVQTITLGWMIVADESGREITASILYLIVSVYALVLSVLSLGSSHTHDHWQYTVHLASLSAVSLFLLLAITLLPSPPSRSPAHLWYTSLLLWLFAFWTSSHTPRGPDLHFPSSRVYHKRALEGATTSVEDNVCGIVSASPWSILLFSYTTRVVLLGYTATRLEIGDLPLLPAAMRAPAIFANMRRALNVYTPSGWGRWRPKYGSGWQLTYQIIRVNGPTLVKQLCLIVVLAVLFYSPAFFLQKLVKYLEDDPLRENQQWGWVWCVGMFVFSVIRYLVDGQAESLSITTLQVRIRVQLNTILFAKTLVRKDIASSDASSKPFDDPDLKAKVKKVVNANGDAESTASLNADDDEFSSKAQIMTLMTTDVDRVSECAMHSFALFGAPIEIAVGTILLYNLLGVSCFIGLFVTGLFLPMNHYASKVVVVAQDNLMKARDERVALMNEVLGAIRMLKFMAWERSFKARVLNIREKELKYQRLNYTIKILLKGIWNASALLVTLVSFWHFTVIRGQTLTPSIAFTSVTIFFELKFALNALPETFINMLQSFVSLRRIEEYLGTLEVSPAPPLDGKHHPILLQSATITWPQDRSTSESAASSAAPTPRRKFSLIDLTLNFPEGELSLICGKLGSGKTLLLLSLLGEADLLAGQISCPRSPPNIIASFAGVLPKPEDWIVPGACAYVPQAAWLQNDSIRENILFNLQMDEERYQKTLEACALISDLKILEDGDQSEIGERGVNLSGGQKARISLARAVYSRASILFLDDVLSAVDAHTADHLYQHCLKGELMQGRTVILVSHHIQLCAPGASYIVALDNGRVSFAGNSESFKASGVQETLMQSEHADETTEQDTKEEKVIKDQFSKPESMSSSTDSPSDETSPASEASSTSAASTEIASTLTIEKKKPRKLIEEENRAVGRIGRDIWEWYFSAVGGWMYWVVFVLSVALGALGPVAENGWLGYWSGASLREEEEKSPSFYITVYAAISFVGLAITTLRWFILYQGSIHASTVLHERLLETVLFAQIRFHDTVSRGRLLNRFGKDFEGIDSSLADNFGDSFMYFMSVTTTLITITYIGGPPFFAAAIIFYVLYYNVAKVYGHCSRDMRRLDSVSRSPLYSIYGETIAGVPVIRSFGASTKFLRDMLRCVDTNTTPYYWLWGVNRWVSTRFCLLSCGVFGVTAVVALMNPRISASLAGFALAFSSTVTYDLLYMVMRFVGLEQSMVAVERVKEYSELQKEGPEFVEPRPPEFWPVEGRIDVEDLVIRYAPELPDVLHKLNFTIYPGEKVGILGRTGSGKSTLALSFFRFVEATEGRILVDNVDISKIGLSDLRSRLTIIPQDPTILSGTLRSTLDVFNEYEDAEIYEALRRVHLIPSGDEYEDPEEVNTNVFRNLDSSVSEGGDNFSTGEKQLLCMARAILKRSKVLVMDEATASVDYATDELIGKTIRHEFAESSILTIAQRLRTVIDYNRVILLDQGRIVEFDTPQKLLSDPNSRFYALCQAAGRDEFAVLRRLAGILSTN